MTNTVNLGMWDRAPFQNSVSRSLDDLNRFLEASEYDTQYKMMPIRYKDIERLKSDDFPDVFILDGGEDVDPGRYGERNTHSHFSKRRDEVEFGFARVMDDNNVRLSGVCRGHQLLNVFFGGTLHQDIRASELYTSGLTHTGGHKVKTKLMPRKKVLALKDFVGDHSFTVSSLHHQAVNDLADGFVESLSWHVKERSSSRSGNNYYPSERGHIIEGIERSDGRVRGLQCHPEFRGYPKDGLMFAYLMHVDSFIQGLHNPSDVELEAKFSHIVKSKTLLKGNDSGPYKVGKGNNNGGVVRTLSRSDRTDRAREDFQRLEQNQGSMYSGADLEDDQEV